jgi:hypothetical protein
VLLGMEATPELRLRRCVLRCCGAESSETLARRASGQVEEQRARAARNGS